jgi:hypothetical protein
LFGAVRVGARPTFAAVGAAYVAWVSPYNPFVGGYEAFFRLGLLSQVLALPVCILFASAVARGHRAWSAPLAALAMAAHPQLALASIAIVGVAGVARGRTDVMVRWARGVAGAFLLGLALYGPGIATNDVPFGWPPDFGWRQLGFGLRRLDWWFLDGDLLDYGRDTPALTALAGAAVLALSLCAARPGARAALAAAVSAIALSSVGRLFRDSSPLVRRCSVFCSRYVFSRSLRRSPPPSSSLHSKRRRHWCRLRAASSVMCGSVLGRLGS